MDNMTNYQLYLTILGFLTEHKILNENIESVVGELFRRAEADFTSIDKGIEALKVESCDTISRQKALHAIGAEIVGVTKEGREILDFCQYIIKHLPPVYAEPRTGHWIMIDECSNERYYCSECRKTVVRIGSNMVKQIRYCPNCGCKME